MAQVDATVADVMNDFGEEVGGDDVFHDVLVSTLYDAAPAVAREVWRTQIGGPLPDELLRHWGDTR